MFKSWNLTHLKIPSAPLMSSLWTVTPTASGTLVARSNIDNKTCQTINLPLGRFTAHMYTK